jgi:pimeloyl-ACP methyl ester carboxylesterase
MRLVESPLPPETAAEGYAEVDIPGPWEHRDLSANGARFHVVEAAPSGGVHPAGAPLILLLHGFPEFWWAWRHQLPALADAGYRAVAMDLRGYGGSDKPPRGYDPATLAADVAGVIRALGEPRATLVGHGWGGLVAWSAAVLQALHVTRLAVVSAPHPLRLRGTGRVSSLRAVAQAMSYQLPVVPEKRLIARDGARVENILRRASRPGWPDAETARRYREVFAMWPTPHCALEYHRWAARSAVRSDGRQYAASMAAPVGAPVLQIHGSMDKYVPAATAMGSAQYVAGSYRWRELMGVGHFPPEEVPATFTRELLDWLGDEHARDARD